MATPRILVLDNSPRTLRVVKRCLRALGYEVKSVDDAERLKLELRAAPASAIVASADLSNGAGLDIVRDLYGQVDRPLPVLALSAERTVPEIIAAAPVELLLGGALTIPLDPAELARAITKIVPPPDRTAAARVLDDLIQDVGEGTARLQPPEGELRIESTPLAVTLWSVDFNDWTGSLHVRDAPGGGLTLWCEFGQLVFARSGAGRDVLKTAVLQGRIKQSAIPDVPLRNIQDETGLLMALRAIGMHEVDKIVSDTVVRLLREALGLRAGRVLATEDETSEEELANPLSLPPLMAQALADRRNRLDEVHVNASLVVRLPAREVVDGWGFAGVDAAVLAKLRAATQEETRLGEFVDRIAKGDEERRHRAVAMLDLMADSGFLQIQGRAFDAETERRLSEMVRVLHGALRGNKFEVLGLDLAATEAQIKEAGRDLVKKYHPDNFFDSPQRIQDTAAALFEVFQGAYATLKSADSRDAYRQELRGDGDSAAASLRSDPELCKVAVHKGRRLLEKKRYTDAVAKLRDATLHDPSSVEAQVLFGWASYLDSGDPSVGSQELEKALRMDARSADAWFYLGRIAALQKDASRAAKRYRKALSFDPNHREAQREIRLHERREEEAGKAAARESGNWGRGLLRRLSRKDDA